MLVTTRNDVFESRRRLRARRSRFGLLSGIAYTLEARANVLEAMALGAT